jgi:ABC-type polysaccharide/polyol phosphate transport system ATPase subunit
VSSPSVVFDAVWKRFRRGERHNSLRDLIPAIGRRLVQPRRADELRSANDFWAIRDASFEVQPGAALGIIGPNGAGKSTTLKLLTRILKPTRGRCTVSGRIGALIEVAAGFHPDLTGRENIYLQGAIMGMKRREIDEKRDAIVDFAGVSEFLDTPIKRYSSGMNARLGFAIAAHLDPDVLLIDEVLAVGDLAFQEQCFERMQKFKQSGAAIVFVSHNLSAVAALCDRVALFDHGAIVTVGTPAEAFAAYAGLNSVAPRDSGPAPVLQVLNQRGEPIAATAAGKEVVVCVSMQPPYADGAVAFGLRIKCIETGQYVFLTTTPSLGCQPIHLGEKATVDLTWRFQANLARGHYFIEVAAIELAHRRQLLVVASPPLAVSESQSERGTAYLASSCEIALSEPHECLTVTSAR